ncbi:hypothetical protein M3685_26580 [Heyndrickxia oleronia]|uniref:hypothetical protein n=1 Tax=Heyndrickxia oleronia TaxID=38875 RepID=UPI0015D0F422|nr:hypothetical protein [Heyndrickxia oleronia]MCM3457440.1 hypothetical protein [Heyndrickxia oleronia]NYV68895.1 hypothetical protein [Bacillus sp. Gen3]
MQYIFLFFVFFIIVFIVFKIIKTRKIPSNKYTPYDKLIMGEKETENDDTADETDKKR